VPFEPLVPEVRNVRNTNRFRRPAGETEEEFTRLLLDELERTIEAMGPETGVPRAHGAGAELRRRLHAAVGYWQGVRELCDRYDILLSADEVITASGGSAPGSPRSATTSGPT
jgi:adenosylmethionine-8-amino-7-oxononanoate aminotransferase